MRSYLHSLSLSTEESSCVVCSTQAVEHLIYHAELSLTCDRSTAVLVLECLVVDSNECLLTYLIHIRNSHKSEFSSRNLLGNASLECNGSRNVGHCILKRCAYQNLLRNRVQLHRKRLLILCRSETTDWLEVRLEEVDVRTFRYKECTDVGIACIRIEIWERGSLLVCLGYSTIGNLDAEGIRV